MTKLVAGAGLLGALIGGTAAVALYAGDGGVLAAQQQLQTRPIASAAVASGPHKQPSPRPDGGGTGQVGLASAVAAEKEDRSGVVVEGRGRGGKERVAVLGAGVVGLATAYYLARTGRYEVVVIERQPGPAMETSFANGGQNCVSDFMPMTDGTLPRRVLAQQLLRLRFNMLSALGRGDQENRPPPYYLVRLKALFDPLVAWSLWLLLRRSSDEAAVNSGRGILHLALSSQQCLQQIREEEQLQYDRGSPAGILHLYRSDDQFEEAKREVEMLQRTFGTKVKPCAVWDADQCRTREPALRDSRASIVGGIWWEDNESGDCNMFTARLADTCRSKYGVTFLFDTGVSLLMRDPANPHRVRALLTDEGREVEVDRVVVCLGSYTPLLLRRSLDVWLPIFPVKGYSLTLRPDDAPLTSGGGHDAAPSLNIADIESKTYIARFGGILGDRLRVVGMGELCGYDQNVDPAKEGVTNLTAVVGQLFPRLPSSASREASLWACLRPMTPDSLPIIGPVGRMENVYVNSGHGSMGWTLACGSGKLTAALVAGTPTDLDPTPYAQARFS